MCIRPYSTAFAADVGLLIRSLDSSFSVGFAVQNIGTQLTYITTGDPLPLTYRGGVAFKLRESDIDSWLLTADAVYYDSALKYNAGVECTLFKMLALRAGYRLNYNPDSLSVGAGFKLDQLCIDYSYVMLGTLDSMQMFTVSYKFGGQSDIEIAQAYLQKGMKERALYVLRAIKRGNVNYNNALKLISSIEHKTALGSDIGSQTDTSVVTGAKIKIAVMNLDPKNTTEDTASLISDMLRNDMFEMGKYSVVERSSIDKIIKEQSLQKSGCSSTECAVEVGRLLNVQQILIGTVGRLGEQYLITVRLVDVETGELLSTASDNCYTESDLASVCKIIAKKIGQR